MRLLRRGRSTAVVAILLAGAIGIISSTQTWLSVDRADAGESILVPGADALALLAPLSLTVLALGTALTLVGRALRYVFGTLALLAGALLTWWTAEIVFTAPVSAVEAIVTETTGLAGGTAVSDVVASIAPTFWPVLALVGWVLLTAGSVFTLLTANRWKSGGRRFRTDAAAHSAAEGPVDAIDSWDDLSRGTDPTR